MNPARRPPARPAHPVDTAGGQAALAGRLEGILGDAVELLRPARLADGAGVPSGAAAGPLIEQCLELCRRRGEALLEPVRTLHHFACTGGTLISRCVAAMPNVYLLSEIDPLSTLGRTPGRPQFAPTDTKTLLTQGVRPVQQATLQSLFAAELRVLVDTVQSSGAYLVLRDHAHSHFCVGAAVPDRPTVRAMASELAPVLSVLTVRDPIDSFLSLRTNDWLHFSPGDFSEYCRRYLAFLAAYEGVPVVQYETFVDRPDEEMQRICSILDLPYNDAFEKLLPAIRMTGDSGRRSWVIARRPPRQQRAELEEVAQGCPDYRRLADALGYAAA